MSYNVNNVQVSMQECYQSFPTIVLGSGASMPYGLPSMRDIGMYLLNNMSIEDKSEKEAWNQIEKALENDSDKNIEAVLGDYRHIENESLHKKVIELIWKCVNEKDMAAMELAALGKTVFDLGNLLKGMFLSNNTVANIITTNYDRIAEYACNSKGILFQTDFPPGYLQRWKNPEDVCYRIGRRRDSPYARVVKIHKVHGSLDWLSGPNDEIICLPMRVSSHNLSPLILTPGVGKFGKAHQEPFRTIISNADAALRNSSAILCVGFGFGDAHIYPVMKEICGKENIPVIVLALKLSDEAKTFLRNNAGANYTGIEECPDGGCMVYTSCNPDGTRVYEPDLWSLTEFCNLVL